ncbi:hypothetical protein [Nocardia cerradoensis]|uniref:hypothetical protein n=1 Tax=Nocardia cerradoensis TaxID=85688 RepID=UPI0012F704CA|nr:hypothetical protein [Nocardia cerradoensis]
MHDQFSRRDHGGARQQRASWDSDARTATGRDLPISIDAAVIDYVPAQRLSW